MFKTISKLGKTNLDRAIIASMAAMTIFVLSQQLQSATSFAIGAVKTAQSA
jgi:hypothetical protein